MSVRIGIIGSGGIAKAHAKAYQTMEDVQVVAVADIIPGKAESFIASMALAHARAFEHHSDMLGACDLDGVSVCTPNFAHHQTSVDALSSGAHVLVEKPMSVTLDQAIDMVRASKASGRMLSVGFQPRYDPNMQIIRDFVQSGRLGQVYYVEVGGGRRRGIPGRTFVRKETAGAGAMADIGCYSIDMAMHALGYPKPLTVSAYTSSFFGTNPKYFAEADQFNVEDFGVALIRLEGGIVLNFKISWAMHMDSLGATIFLGTDAGLKITSAGQGPWSGVWDGKVGSIRLFHDIDGHHTDSEIPVKSHQINLFQEKVKDFVTAIREGRQAPIPGEQILLNQAIVDGIQRSALEGREVEISIPEL